MRTEEQKISQDPIQVILGGKEHDVKLLVIKDSREWRKGVVKLLASLPQYAKADTDDPVAFEEAMGALLNGMPDTVIDLFFEYAKDLKRSEIEAVATDLEIAEAFKKVVDVAFPLVGSVGTLAEKLGQ